MRILAVGGTGLISSAFAAQCAARGDDLTLVTRGRTHTAAPPAGAHIIHADATDPAALRSALHGARLRKERWDAVVQFIAFHPDQVREDVATFASLTDRYMLVATSAAYATSDRLHLLTEDTPLENPHWRYAQDKIACEAALREAAPAAGLDYTIIRPAHTYGPSKIPAFTGNSKHPWTVVDRMRRGADILIPGDGTSLWTVTHADDVAAGMRGLAESPSAAGQAVHVTSDVAYTWRAIYATIADAAGISATDFERQSVCVPSDAIIAAAPDQEGSIRGDKMHNAAYDNSKIKALVPGWEASTSFADGMRQAIKWFEADPSRQTIDEDANRMFDSLAATYRAALDSVRA